MIIHSKLNIWSLPGSEGEDSEKRALGWQASSPDPSPALPPPCSGILGELLPTSGLCFLALHPQQPSSPSLSPSLEHGLVGFLSQPHLSSKTWLPPGLELQPGFSLGRGPEVRVSTRGCSPPLSLRGSLQGTAGLLTQGSVETGEHQQDPQRQQGFRGSSTWDGLA